MPRAHALDFVGIDVEPGHQDHVFLSVLEENVAVGVDAADVAGAQPVAKHHLFGFLRPVPITAHYLRPEYADLAHGIGGDLLAVVVANRNIRGGNRQPDTAVEIGADRIGGGHRRGLGQSPPLGHHAACDLLPAFGDDALQGHAPGKGHSQGAEVHGFESGCVKQGIEQGVYATDEVEFVLLELLDEPREIPRVGDQYVACTQRQKGEAVRGEGKYMVERQGANDDAGTARPHRGKNPGGGLQHVGDHVAMGEHRRFGDTGRAAGVLQKGDVFRPERYRVELQAEAGRERALERLRPRHSPGRNLLADVPQHEVDDEAPRDSEQITDPGHQDLLEGGARQDLLQHVCEILEDHDAFRRGIVELMLEFASGVQRIRVHDYHAGSQHSEY